MPKTIPDDSVGLVQSQTIHFTTPLQLECGVTLEEHDISYETYGELNQNQSNAILVCHALSGNQHAAGYNSMDDKKPGWWEVAIGPGKALDTNKFFIISPNNLGGCNGSTGPTSINPATGQPYGPEFPLVTVKDWVKSQEMLAENFAIKQWAAVVGGSLGGMQVLQWSIDLPEKVRHAVVIAAAPRLSAQNIAFNEVARHAIQSDPGFHDGNYIEHNTIPAGGLKIARMLGHITYLSDEAMRAKFGREMRSDKLKFDFGVEFQVESYLRYQGQSFADKFDANTYRLMTKALDYFDPASEYNDSLSQALSKATADFLVVSFTSDWRFSPARSQEIVRALLNNKSNTTYAEIEAHHGHDAFLMPIPEFIDIFKSYMKRVEKYAG